MSAKPEFLSRNPYQIPSQNVLKCYFDLESSHSTYIIPYENPYNCIPLSS